MKVFIATSLKNKKEVQKIVKTLEDLSVEYQCCLTEKDNLEGEELFNHNYRGILDSDLFISVLKNLGKDVSTEIGMAYALNKKRIGINYNIDKKDLMPYFAAGEIIKENEVGNTLKKIIKSH
jgi:hypothetical protein